MTWAPSAERSVVGRTRGAPEPGLDIECIVLVAGELRVEVLTYGAHLVGVWAPARDGTVDNLVSSLRDDAGRVDPLRYEDPVANPHLGATIGRYANRIGGARFVLDGDIVELLANEGPNQLHGGPVGFDRHVWQASTASDTHAAEVTLRHTSPHGDQGFPGTVEVQVRYRLDDQGGLSIDHEGWTDAPTVLNLTNHSYWNLHGTSDGADAHIGSHELRVDAGRVVEVDTSMIPTGALRHVAHTVFDLRRPTLLGPLLSDGALVATKGLDHCYVLDAQDAQDAQDAPDVDRRTPAPVELSDPASGRRLRLWTDQPGVQVYTSNHGAGDLPAHSTVCLETQALPDTPNHPQFPSTVLRPGVRYRHQQHLRFSVDD